MKSLKAINLRSPISPAAIAANTNDWNPTGLANASVIRMDASAAINITGISVAAIVTGLGDGRVLCLTHVGTNVLNTITLTQEDAASTAAHRFTLPAAANIVVPIGGSVIVWYDITSARWRALAKSL